MDSIAWFSALNQMYSLIKTHVANLRYTSENTVKISSLTRNSAPPLKEKIQNQLKPHPQKKRKKKPPPPPKIISHPFVGYFVQETCIYKWIYSF